MDAIRLHGSGNGVNVSEEEGEEPDIELFSGKYVGLIDGLDVVVSVIGREGDACERDFNACMLQRGNDLVEIGASRGDGKAAESVVASELDDGDRRVRSNDVVETVDAIFGGVSADAHVKDVIVVTA